MSSVFVAKSLLTSDFQRNGARRSFGVSDQISPPRGVASMVIDAGQPERAAARLGALAKGFSALDLSLEGETGTLWQFMQPGQRPSFTLSLLAEMFAALEAVRGLIGEAGGQEHPDLRFLVLASRMPGIFNLGGDLPLFMQLIERRDRQGLTRYAHACIDVQFARADKASLPIHTIALVQGDALGGGFECALTHDVIVAERSAKFGLPEILFNLFPGMGAYSFLARRLDHTRAERMMLSGQIYSASELHEMGLVDIVADDGEGVEAVRQYIAQTARSYHGRNGIYRARQMVNPVTRAELIQITDLWVETALNLDPLDLRRMRHLATAQDRRWAKINGEGTGGAVSRAVSA